MFFFPNSGPAGTHSAVKQLGATHLEYGSAAAAASDNVATLNSSGNNQTGHSLTYHQHNQRPFLATTDQTGTGGGGIDGAYANLNPSSEHFFAAAGSVAPDQRRQDHLGAAVTLANHYNQHPLSSHSDSSMHNHHSHQPPHHHAPSLQLAHSSPAAGSLVSHNAATVQTTTTAGPLPADIPCRLRAAPTAF